jgi:hypothetical protein
MRLLKQLGLVLLGAASIIALLFGVVLLGGTWHEAGPDGKAILVAIIVVGAAGLYASHRALERMRSFDADEKFIVGLQQAAEFRGDRLEASMRPASMVLMLAITLFVAFVGVACVALLMSGRKDALLPAVIGVPTCALVVAYALQTLWLARFSGRPWLRMDTRAIDVLPYGAIPWQDVVALGSGLEARSRRPFLTLVVRQPGRFLRGNSLNRIFAGGRIAADIGELRIPIGILDVHSATVAEAAQQLRGRVQPPLLQVWIPGMTAAQVEQQLRNEAHMARIIEINEGDPKLIDAAEIAEVEAIAADLAGPNPLAPAIEANARRGKRLLWLLCFVFALAIALQVYRFLRIL